MDKMSQRKPYETTFVPRREVLPFLGDTRDRQERKVVYITDIHICRWPGPGRKPGWW